MGLDPKIDTVRQRVLGLNGMRRGIKNDSDMGYGSFLKQQGDMRTP